MMLSSQAQLPQGPAPQMPKLSGKKKKPNYAQIHAKPLPLDVYPLPNFYPSHPLSLFQLAWGWLSQAIWPRSSHPKPKYVGYFDSHTRSIHVTDLTHVRALWEMGFFGKGLLSRSEPTWLEREKARLEATRQGGGTAEEWTAVRREERRRFKLERAREERERVEKQRALERGQLDGKLSESEMDRKDGAPLPLMEVSEPPFKEPSLSTEATLERDNAQEDPEKDTSTLMASQRSDEEATADATRKSGYGGNGTSSQDAVIDTSHLTILKTPDEAESVGHELGDREHLQLNLEEAFFLVYALGVLTVHTEGQAKESVSSVAQLSQQTTHRTSCEASELLALFMRHSQYPQSERGFRAAPDNPFLLSYVTYHHFRSRGWVVRPGVKFSCDFLLYNRGPVFSHAEYAVMIVPSYSHPYWTTEIGQKTKCSQPSEENTGPDLHRDSAAT
ncbi:hypothetical protein K431DRAFT_297740 [Polychaeton citri CBS 116435]|uniref:tRNA-splicing endonuclease subunit Sen2 n=1 Tax=Polychaeton citri CBS 116435 TaxID=1314669 RepID=A0A9P4Q3S8_9PEZI|nr:hypothetical protein K431DRAFT_297740 [Polychaeton citri CBS 116435]